MLHQVMQEFKETEEGEMLMEDIVSQFREQVEEVSSSTVKKTGYLVDCFREATAFPIAKERELPAFNLSSLHGKSIKK